MLAAATVSNVHRLYSINLAGVARRRLSPIKFMIDCATLFAQLPIKPNKTNIKM